MIELKFLRPLYVFLGIGWKLRFTGSRDQYPCIEYVCAFCKKREAWVASAAGFKGKVPMYRCCPQMVPYPINRTEFAAHLVAKAEFNNDEEVQRTPFIDEWERASGEYPCTAHRTRELGC